MAGSDPLPPRGRGALRPLDEDAWEPATGRRRWPLLLAGVALLAGGAWLAGSGGDGGFEVGERTGPPDAAPPEREPLPLPEETERPSVAEAPGGGSWVRMGGSPAEASANTAGAWTGQELVVAGGGDTAAAFDPEARRWRRLPPRPSNRAVDDAVWTGEEVVVWSAPRAHRGGGGDTVRPHAEAGAASGTSGGSAGELVAYDPDADAWRTLPEPPVSPKPAVVGWSDRELLLWGPLAEDGDGGDEATAVGHGGAAYDPAADAWRALPEAPLPPLEDAAGAWAPHRAGRDRLVVLAAPRDPDQAPAAGSLVAAYDPAEDRWEELAAPPVADAVGLPTVWTDRELIVWGAETAGYPPEERRWAEGAALDPEQDMWRRLPAAPDPRVDSRTARGVRPVWTGRQVLLPGAATTRGAGLIYEPSRDAWMSLTTQQFPYGAVNAWTGEALLSWGGLDHIAATRAVRVWTPELGLTTPIVPERRPTGRNAW